MRAKKKRETGAQKKARARTQAAQKRSKNLSSLLEVGKFLDREEARLLADQAEKDKVNENAQS